MESVIDVFWMGSMIQGVLTDVAIWYSEPLAMCILYELDREVLAQCLTTSHDFVQFSITGGNTA